MSGDAIGLNQSADVFWLPLGGEPPIVTIRGGEQKHFESLRDTVAFTMETLPPRDRATAWISLHTGSLKIEEIEALHRELEARDGQ